LLNGEVLEYSCRIKEVLKESLLKKVKAWGDLAEAGVRVENSKAELNESNAAKSRDQTIADQRERERTKNSVFSPIYRNILAEPIDFGQIKSISDKHAFDELLLPQKRIVGDEEEPVEIRRKAVMFVLGLYRIRISHLATKKELGDIQNTLKNYADWLHLITSDMQTYGFPSDFNLLRVSNDEIARLEETVTTIRACELVKTEEKQHRMAYFPETHDGNESPMTFGEDVALDKSPIKFPVSYKCTTAACMGKLDSKYLVKERETRENIAKYLGKKPYY